MASNTTDLEQRVDELESIIENQQEVIERLERRLEDGATEADSGFSVSRRHAIQGLGLAGLVGLGATATSAQPQGRIGTPDRPLETVYTAGLDGDLTNGDEVTELAGNGLDIDGDSGQLSVDEDDLDVGSNWSDDGESLTPAEERDVDLDGGDLLDGAVIWDSENDRLEAESLDLGETSASIRQLDGAGITIYETDNSLEIDTDDTLDIQTGDTEDQLGVSDGAASKWDAGAFFLEPKDEVASGISIEEVEFGTGTTQQTAGPIANGIVEFDGESWFLVNGVNVEDISGPEGEVNIELDGVGTSDEIVALVTPTFDQALSAEPGENVVEVNVPQEVNVGDRIQFGIYQLPEQGE